MQRNGDPIAHIAHSFFVGMSAARMQYDRQRHACNAQMREEIIHSRPLAIFTLNIICQCGGVHRTLFKETLIKCFYRSNYCTVLAAGWRRKGFSFQDFHGEHASSFGAVGLAELVGFSADEWHRSFDEITFLS
jgi:hypothetical protein